jgi:hypothetical protein
MTAKCLSLVGCHRKIRGMLARGYAKVSRSFSLADKLRWGLRTPPPLPLAHQSLSPSAKLTWYTFSSVSERMVNWRDPDAILHQLGTLCRRW